MLNILATLPTMEASMGLSDLIELGKKLDLSGNELQGFVEKQQERAREERQLRREAEREAREREQRAEEEAHHREMELKRLDLEIAEAARSRFWKESGEEKHAPRTPAKLDIPKFENSLITSVDKYLDLFDSVVKLNGYSEAAAALALRTAVMGTKLESVVTLGGSYKEMKKEILTTHGARPEQLWSQLVNTKQGEESFRQWCAKICTRLSQFLELVVRRDERGDMCTEQVVEALIKYLALEGCSQDLRVFFLERKMEGLSLDEFQELGVAYQGAHGRPLNSELATRTSLNCSERDCGCESAMPPSSSDSTGSMQAWKVSVVDLTAAVAALPETQRKKFVMSQRLCFVCLKTGHHSKVCYSHRR